MSEHITHYINEYKQSQPSLVGANTPWLRDLRQHACDQLSQIGFPTRKQEEWKYTRTHHIEQHPYSAQADKAANVQLDQLTPWLIDDLECYRVVFVNGQLSNSLSTLDAMDENISCHSLAQAVSQDDMPAFSKSHQQRYTDIFAALNTAFMNDGCYLKIAKNHQVDKPIHIIYFCNQANAMTTLRHRFILEEGAQATIIESYVGNDDAQYFNNSVSHIHLADQACLQHYKLLRHGNQASHIDRLLVSQAYHSHFTAHSFALGGAWTRSDTEVDLEAEGAECELNGLYIGQNKQHIDHHTQINHLKPHGVSREYYKGILDQQARGVFSGKVYVAKDAQQTLAEQQNRNLLLTKTAEVDTKPQLEIFANDVKCAHGATVGQLDKQALFYLQSRGISLLTAQRLLVQAFARQVIDKVKVEKIKTLLEQTLEDITWSQP